MNKFYSITLSKKFKALLMLLVASALYTSQVSAQVTFDAQKAFLDTTKKKQITEVPLNTRSQKKRFGRAVLYLGIAEFTPFAYDRWIAGKDYAKITFATVGHNLNPGHWQIDNDPFQTNQFGHPFHGSLFYSSFRVNGYSFWEAAPAAAAGSYLWETFAETQAPAPNDFINTTFGGIVLGEMTYRFANRLINNRATGFKRQVQEVAGLIMNPMNGLNRIVDGRWGKVRANSALHDSTKLNLEVDAGVRYYNTVAGFNTSGFYGRAKLTYGLPYDNYRVPFSNIYVNAEFGRDDSAKVNAINVYGSLTGWELKNDSSSRHLAVLSANYDYIRNAGVFYGGQSVKLNVFSEYNLHRKVKFNTGFSAGPVLLGAAPDPYFYNSRNYDYTTGASFAAGGGLSIKDRFFLNAEYRGGYLATINGYSSHYLLHTITSEIRFAVTKDLSLCADPGYLVIKGKYNKFAETQNTYSYFRATVRYGLNL
ncbi:DUF3943 domain-containing protein [Mucilaginibacter ginkgonis]|uniref:DUF3943 domain-containing protein n=1 Tax=Mucilaginibacter ginkgonis TaxID=2682091 RepID=A0A7T7F884_9SPHI|nr:DUF3943 domain-containing protein [Mucilaginibacter ginkgonis]QQL48616.1 DUF3943 domain-containing protein [Mucilaginibacter ginkgonis]